MPFRETNPVAERIALMREFETGVFSVSELCRRHGISRETFYVWQRRCASGEARWFEDRSHAVACCPHATDGRIAERIIAVRRRFPHFGPKKIKARLEDIRDDMARWIDGIARIITDGQQLGNITPTVRPDDEAMLFFSIAVTANTLIQLGAVSDAPTRARRNWSTQTDRIRC
jgi:transposase-like protein